jgi:hypothetical protein
VLGLHDQMAARSLVACWRRQFAVYTGNTHRLCLTEMERAILEADVAKLRAFAHQHVPRHSPDKQDFSEKSKNAMETRARQMSPSKMVNAGTIGDGSEDTMMKMSATGV